MEKLKLNGIEQRIQVLPLIVQRYIVIGNRLNEPDLTQQAQNNLRKERLEIWEKMKEGDRWELISFGEYISQRLKANKPIAPALQYGIKK